MCGTNQNWNCPNLGELAGFPVPFIFVGEPKPEVLHKSKEPPTLVP
jgi:hypothetical protein